MVREVTGDLTRFDADFICHQANFYGVMGGGVALSIWHRLLDAPAKTAYRELCMEKGRELLGKAQYLPIVREDGRPGLLFNLFCQDDRPQADGGLTRYDCMRTCLKAVEKAARQNGNRTVALPGYMGCGIAGGNWHKVYGIIMDVFAESPIECTIVYWEGDDKR